MSRRRQRPEEANDTDRWIVSYADVLTLLFAFFAMLYGISITDVSKAQRLVDSLRESFGSEVFEEGSDRAAVLDAQPTRPIEIDHPRANPNLGRPADQKRLDVLGERVEEMAKGEAETEGLSVRRTEEGLVISLADTLFFSAQDEELPDSAQETLSEVAALLEGVPNHVRVEGHTDDRPIRRSSNWELSTRRAVKVAEVLLGQGVAPFRVSVAGFADQRPLMTNSTEAGRRINRRVDIVVLRARGADKDT
jgi:chemotaxis protein MotB